MLAVKQDEANTELQVLFKATQELPHSLKISEEMIAQEIEAYRDES